MPEAKRLSVPGFQASGIHCGIKAKDLDLALVVSDVPASVAGVFTRSTVVGAPVELNRDRVRSGKTRGVVVNSGCSNVAMGDRGRRDARRMSSLAAEAVGCRPEDMLVASTGVIGEPLPMKALRSGIPKAAEALSPEGLPAAAEAILTTDTYAKSAVKKIRLGGKSVTIAGIAKGSGMIEPDMATMLAFLVTDAAAAPSVLRGVLKRVAQQTFNRVSVDGEGSTSDTALLMANGLAGNPRLTRSGEAETVAFEAAVRAVAESLAQDLARDGEGATKLVTIQVRGAQNRRQAEGAARRVANSMLVKTALFGGDPNWGRILQTIGAGRYAIDLGRACIRLGGVAVFRRGQSTGPAARRRAEAAQARDEILIEIDLGVGEAEARMWTCDLSYDYVKINAEYTT